MKETLNLPKTSFPMKANLSKRELEILAYWEEINIYEKIRANSLGKKKFIFHDGPPYANGEIHIGTALNKILKDIIVKYKTLKGFDVPYIPGWDTHGLPIELKVISKLKAQPGEQSCVELRRRCKEYAEKYIEIQKKQFIRLGAFGDWDNPYLTFNPEYEAEELKVFKELFEKGYIFKGTKPIYWCCDCETALAEAEIEYKDHESPSIFVKFPLMTDISEKFPSLKEYELYFVIWTTTPWTLPANVAICLNEVFEYSFVFVDNEVYIIASELVDTCMNQIGIGEFKIIGTCKGSDLENLVCQHPFIDREVLVILGPHVTLEQGTGCVHTAPGHGQEDYVVGQKYELPVISPIDNKGYFTVEAHQFAGLFYEKANEKILEVLDLEGYLMHSTKTTHQYPHCWRCKKPVIFRATPQWFISVEKSDIRKKCIEAIKKVRWVPEWGENRILGMMDVRPDWCISRQRIWGVPIPAFYCTNCKTQLINSDIIDAVIELVAEKGSDAWFYEEVSEILPEGITCVNCGSKNFERESDILDVWFDSGVSHRAVLETRKELSWPSDLYLEGSDQHRGWFQTSLITSVGTRNMAPYKIVLTHGFVVDGEGKKMSKSLGNVIKPQEIVEKSGADMLRLWAASSDYKDDVRISDKIMSHLTDAYRKIRNTIRFLMGNLYDFKPEFSVNEEELLPLDRWAYARLKQLILKVESFYENFEFYKLYHELYNFCTIDMSSFYLDILKDRLYTSYKESFERRSAQTVLYKILKSLAIMLAPVLSFTSEEIWLSAGFNETESVFLGSWPEVNFTRSDEHILKKFELIMQLRSEITRALEHSRLQKKIGHSLDAKVIVVASSRSAKKFIDVLEGLSPESIFIVSGFEIAESFPTSDDVVTAVQIEGLKIKVEKAAGKKCPRCWKYFQDEERGNVCKRCENVLNLLEKKRNKEGKVGCEMQN